MPPRLTTSVIVGLFAACMLGTASAADIRVPLDQPTIQAAIDASATGDVVLIAPGTYYESLNLIEKQIELRSETGETDVVVDAQDSGRCLYATGFDTNLSISNMIFQNGNEPITRGSGTGGSGLRLEYGDFVLDQCIVRNCSVSSAVVCDTGAFEFIDCGFIDNSNQGVRVWNSYGSRYASFTGCRFLGNEAGSFTVYGVALRVAVSTVTVNDCVIAHNSGPLAIVSCSTNGSNGICEITNSRICNNDGQNLEGNCIDVQDNCISENCDDDCNLFLVPRDYETIQAGIDACEADDTILVGPGTYDGPIDFLTRNIILKSTSGPELTILDGSNTNESILSMRFCNTPARLEGFTIQNADGGSDVAQDGNIIIGGGIRVLSGAPVIENCHFKNCRSGYGGGMHVGGSDITISNCSFTECRSSANGGALLIINGQATIEDCVFDDNRATLQGGAIHIVNGDGHSMRNSTVSNNYAIDGGGISWQNVQTEFPFEIIDSVITANDALNSGGGIRSVAGSQPVAFVGSTLCDNTPDEIIGPFVDNGNNTLCVCPPDINGNGTVDVNDILVIVAQWGTSGPQADVNQDGIVDITDLLITLDEFGSCANL